jgi:hypothetical protein
MNPNTHGNLRRYKAVDPSSADVDITGEPCDAIHCSAAGTATLTQPGGSVRTDIPLDVGWNPISAVKIESTGLTATIDAIGWYD